jgi:uncharacterized protein YndB with AHSA1/START domain
MAAKTLKIKRTLNAPPAEVYRAFTNSSALREWFCNAATTDAHKGGRFYVWWNSGYYASGEFTALEPGRKVAFTWRGRGEPEATRVQVSLAAKNDATAVTVSHAGVGSGKKWAATLGEFQRGWEVALENLQSVLETGMDLRFTRRPLFGISGGDELNPEIAARLGVPVVEGLRLEGLTEGMGAQAAGLQKDDVIVGLGGKKITGWTSFFSFMQAHRAGDAVPVVFYRGNEKRKTTMTLSVRPLPEVPPTPQALAEAVRNIYAELDAELAKCFERVSEAEADHHPARGEWNAKENLAHLIIDERDRQAGIDELINGEERWYDGFAGNLQVRHAATVAACPTVPALLEELKRHEAETVALLTALPPEFVARKGSYWRLGYGLLLLSLHTREHIGQIRAAIASARQKKS